LFSGSYDNTIKQWSLHTGDLLRTLEGHVRWISIFLFSQGAQYLFSGDNKGEIKQWSVDDGSLIQTLVGGLGEHVTSLAVSTDDKFLFSGHDASEDSIKQWCIKTGQLIRTFSNTKYVESLLISTDGQYLFDGSNYGTIRQWRLFNPLEYLLQGIWFCLEQFINKKYIKNSVLLRLIKHKLLDFNGS